MGNEENFHKAKLWAAGGDGWSALGGAAHFQYNSTVRQAASQWKKTIVCTIYMGLKEQDTTYQPAPAKMCSAAAMLKRLAAKPVA